MKQKLGSIIKKGKILCLAGIMSLAPSTLNAQPLEHYIEPRVGLISPATKREQGYKPSSLIGAAYGFNIKKVGLGLEVGLDYFHSSEKNIETNTILSRLNVSYSPSKQKAEIKPYLLGGVNFLNEVSKIDIPKFNVHDKVSNTTFGLEFGVGATISNKINSRFTYTVLPTSENVKDMITLTIGYRFMLGGKLK